MKLVHTVMHIMLLTLLSQTVVQASEDKFAGNHADEIQSHLSLIKKMLPDAKSVSELQGNPLAADVYDANGKTIGYAYYTDDLIKIPAYSGKLIHTLVVIDASGRIAGIEIISHHEPILLVGISDERLKEFTDQYEGNKVTDIIRVDGQTRDGHVSVDSISGATITVMVINESVIRSMSDIAASRGIEREQKLPEPVLEVESMWSSVWRDKVIEISLLLAALVGIMLVLRL